MVVLSDRDRPAAPTTAASKLRGVRLQRSAQLSAQSLHLQVRDVEGRTSWPSTVRPRHKLHAAVLVTLIYNDFHMIG